MASTDHDPRRAGEALPFLGVALWLAAALAALALGAAPSPDDGGAAADDASAARALEVLERIARSDDGRLSPPRPVGSAANARCRARILDELRRLGLEPEVHEVFGAYPRLGVAGTVRNVVAVLPGDGTRRAAASEGARDAILCMAHLDSVPAGAGIGDDLCGVAAWLEVARAVLAGPALGRDVILLFEDGEEQGLLGAELFAQSHPLSDRVGAVVNLEGRGNSGPSRLFETGAANRWIVEAFGAESRAPSGTSVSVEIYRRMPNDTDYSVWRERGVPGLNFAFIGGIHAYHTPLDDIENLSRASLQHHCTNGLDAVRALAAAPFPGDADFRSEGDAVFLSLGGRVLLRSGVSAARALSVLALVLSFAAGAVLLRRPFVRPGRAFLAAVLVPLMVLGAWAAAHGTRVLLLQLGFAGVQHAAHQGPLVAAMVSTALAAFALLAVPVGRLLGPSEALAGSLALLGALSLAVGFSVVGASFLFFVPTIVAALGAFAAAARGTARAHVLAGFPGLVAAAFLWSGLHAGIVQALGTAPGPVLDMGVPLPVPVVAVPLLVPLLLLAPCLMRAGATPFVTIGALLVAAGGATLCFQLGPFSPTQPGQVSVIVDTPAGGEGPTVLLEGEPPAVERLRRSREGSGGVEAEPAGAPADIHGTVELLAVRDERDGTRVARAMLRVAEGVEEARLSVDGATRLVIDGVPMASTRVQLLGPDREGHELRIESAPGPIPVLELRETRFGIWRPSARPLAAPWVNARPDELTAAHDGDRSRVTSRWPLGEEGGQDGAEDGAEEEREER